MPLFETKYPNNARTVSGTPQLYNDDVILLCDTSVAPVVINLLEIPENYFSTQWKLHIVDISNNAGTNNITVNAGAAQTINNGASATLNVNGAMMIVQIAADFKYSANFFPTGSGGTVEVQDEGVTLTTQVQVMNFVGDDVVASAAGDNVTVTIGQEDTGWLDVGGFTHISTYTERPQYRRIGKMVHFRGNAIIPLGTDADPTILIPMTTAGIGSFYCNDQSAKTYIGAGGCTLDANGAITFNKNASVVPYIFDKTYGRTIIASRVIKTSDANAGVCLNSVFAVFITTDGRLVFGTYKDFELSPNIANPAIGLGAGTLRHIISNVESGQYVPNWTDAGGGSKTHSDVVNTGFDRQFAPVSATNTFLYSVDASEEAQIGGFFAKLDGLIAYLA